MIIISEGTAVSGFAATLQKLPKVLRIQDFIEVEGDSGMVSLGSPFDEVRTFDEVCPRLDRAPGTQATMASNVRSFFFVRNMCGIQVLEFRNYVFYMCSTSYGWQRFSAKISPPGAIFSTPWRTHGDVVALAYARAHAAPRIALE